MTLSSVLSSMSSGLRQSPWLSVLSNKLVSLQSPAHPTVEAWPFLDLEFAVSMVGFYFVTVLVLMKLVQFRGKGFQLKPLVLVHNLSMCALSVYMCVETVHQAIRARYSLFGNAVDDSAHRGYAMARILWIFYLSKAAEFMDTFIMALRYRFRQITFLHVYHHSSIFLVWWYVVRYCPGGESYFTCALNSFVHVVMYGYYFWSALSSSSSSSVKRTSERRRPRWTEPAFYRRYITRLQIGQFLVMMVQASYDIVAPSSQYPREVAVFLFVYMISMLGLFGNFYLQSYKKNHPKHIQDSKPKEA